MKYVALILLAAAGWCIAATPGGTAPCTREANPVGDSLLVLLPTSLSEDGWVQTDTPQVYDTKTLYEFIDGGADLFFEYGFRRVAVAEYNKHDVGSITLEIYEMLDATAACGIYSVRSGQNAQRIALGQEVCLEPYYLMFWKERFYVSITASDSTPAYIRGMRTIAQTVDRNISTTGKRPALLQMLQSEGLSKAQYFRGPLGLASTRTLDLAELFPVIEGVIGRYSDHTVILVRYENELEAQSCLQRMKDRLPTDERFVQYQVTDRMVSVTDRNNRTMCMGRNERVVVTAISPEADIAYASLRDMIRRLGER